MYVYGLIILFIFEHTQKFERTQNTQILLYHRQQNKCYPQRCQNVLIRQGTKIRQGIPSIII